MIYMPTSLPSPMRHSTVPQMPPSIMRIIIEGGIWRTVEWRMGGGNEVGMYIDHDELLHEC